MLEDKEEDTIDGIKYLEFSLIYKYDQLKCNIEMKKYINCFINNTYLDLNQVKNYYWNTVFPKINKLTPTIIDVLKKQYKYKSLFFDDNFIDEHKLFTMLPEHIEYIVLRGINNLFFDQELELDITNLPRELIYLDIDFKFKYKLTLDYLPAGLKVLRLGAKIDVPIENLPQGLIILEIGTQFNQSIDNLPDSIKILIFKTESRSRYVYNSRPYNLYVNKINKLPLELEVLILDDVLDDVICDIDFSYLVNLKYLALPNNFDESAFFESSNKKLPQKLKKLYIGKTYNQIIKILPPELEFLIVHQNFDLEKNLIFLPSSIKKIMVDIRNEIIHNDNCHYDTFVKLEKKFPNIKVGFLST